MAESNVVLRMYSQQLAYKCMHSTEDWTTLQILACMKFNSFDKLLVMENFLGYNCKGQSKFQIPQPNQILLTSCKMSQRLLSRLFEISSFTKYVQIRRAANSSHYLVKVCSVG